MATAFFFLVMMQAQLMTEGLLNKMFDIIEVSSLYLSAGDGATFAPASVPLFHVTWPPWFLCRSSHVDYRLPLPIGCLRDHSFTASLCGNTVFSRVSQGLPEK